ncbi:unnamed protein product [Merluccius merluccius]
MDHLPDSNIRYKEVGYWDERYRVEECFDWCGDFSKFKHLLEKLVHKDDRILVLGCGNSALSGEMYDAGYRHLTNIDYSSVCIDAMAARHAHCPGMTWRQMDMRQLDFPDASFDVVLEKATLDALMVDKKDPWNVSPPTLCLIHQVLQEVSRVLKPRGRFLSLTFAQPHFRKRLYARRAFGWSLAHHTYGDGFHFFFYVMTKGEELSPQDAALETRLLEEAKEPPAACVTSPQEIETEDFLRNIDL